MNMWANKLFVGGLSNTNKLANRTAKHVGPRKMADLDDAEESLILACNYYIDISRSELYYFVRKRRHSIWVEGYLKELEKYGAYNCCFEERLERSRC